MTLYIDIKPTLEWHIAVTQHSTEWRAKTPFGWYVHPDKWVKRIYFPLLLSLDPNSDDFIEIHYDHSSNEQSDPFEAVRAAAQADYERRTAERFRPIVLPPRMDARQGDGSVHYCTGWNDVLDAIAKERGEV